MKYTSFLQLEVNELLKNHPFGLNNDIWVIQIIDVSNIMLVVHLATITLIYAHLLLYLTQEKQNQK